MPRVMIVGAGPLPRSNSTSFAEGALRARQLLDPLLRAGCTVNLFTVPSAPPSTPEGGIPAMLPDKFEGLAYQRFTSMDSEFIIRALGEQARQLQPDALLAIGAYPAYLAAMIPGSIPLWADLDGHWMSQTQGRGFSEGNDARLAEAWAIQRATVRRLDKFSAISRPVLYTTLGELASAGRFNRFTYHYQFGHHLAPGEWRWPLPPVNIAPDSAAQTAMLRGPIVPSDAFVLLWSGPFSPWSAPEDLASAMDILLARHPNAHCVITGAKAEGAPLAALRRFEELVDQSPVKDRYHLIGSVEADKLAAIYREADLGILIESGCYEAKFGAHWRLAAMAGEELPIAATCSTELAEWLEDGQTILGLPLGDPEGIAETIDPWIARSNELAHFGVKAKDFMAKHCAVDDLAGQLLGWLREPKLAPDNQAKLEQEGAVVNDLNAVHLNALEEQTMMLQRYRPSEIQQALADWENREQQTKSRFSFGFHRK